MTVCVEENEFNAVVVLRTRALREGWVVGHRMWIWSEPQSFPVALPVYGWSLDCENVTSD